MIGAIIGFIIGSLFGFMICAVLASSEDDKKQPMKENKELLEKVYPLGAIFMHPINPEKFLGVGKWEVWTIEYGREVKFAEGYENMLSEENKNAIIEEFKKDRIYWVRVE